MKEAQSRSSRLRKAVVYFFLSRIYWSVRRVFPRIVYPNGFTERDLSLSFFSDSYNIINLKDLLILYGKEPLPWLCPYIKNDLTFVRDYLTKIGFASALASSPFYIELLDILYLYSKLIAEVPLEEIKTIEKNIYEQTGGYSLDYHTSELIRIKESD